MRTRTVRIASLGIGAVAVIGLTLIAALARSDEVSKPGEPTVGTVPDSAFGNGGSVNLDDVPNYVAAYGRDGISIVGHVSRDDILGAHPVDGPIAVYARDLTTVVGHMYPGRGFVPLGTDPGDVPTIPVTTAYKDPSNTTK